MSFIDVTGWMPNLLGPVDFLINGIAQVVPKRLKLNFIGNVSIADNASADQTDITFTAAGTVNGQLQVRGTSGTPSATNKLRYNTTNDAVDWIGTNGDSKPMFAELVNLTSTSTQNLITVAMADESMMTIDAIVWGCRRTAVTKAGRIKMSKTYRRTGGGAPTLVAADTPASHNTSFGTGDVAAVGNSLVVQFSAADTDARNVFAEASVRVSRAT